MKKGQSSQNKISFGKRKEGNFKKRNGPKIKSTKKNRGQG